VKPSPSREAAQNTDWPGVFRWIKIDTTVADRAPRPKFDLGGFDISLVDA
jgi:hypothetical protein